MDSSLETKRILVIEDDPGLRDLIELQLVQHAITHAPHQQAAYSALDRLRFDLVLLDLKLPIDERDIDPHPQVGFDTLQSIRRNHPPNHLPVVVMTAYEATSEITKRALKLEATDYWKKDGSYSEDLPTLVGRVLQEHAAEQSKLAQDLEARRHRLDFSRAKQRVSIDGLVTFEGKHYALLAALRSPFLDAAKKGENPPFLALQKLADALDVDQDYLRKLVERLRKRVALTFMKQLGVAPSPEAIIESQQWKGYRLNPSKVDIADISSPSV